MFPSRRQLLLAPLPLAISSLASARPRGPDAKGHWPGYYARRAQAKLPKSLVLHDFQWPQAGPFERRAVVIAPKHLRPQNARVVVLLHGFGAAKTGPEAAAYAWLTSYGLSQTYLKLVAGSTPLTTALGPRRGGRLASLLVKRPFRDVVVVCPYAHNPWRYKNCRRMTSKVAAFIMGPLLKRVATTITPAAQDPQRLGLDGVSFGGWLVIELARRYPGRFGSIGLTQPSIANTSKDRSDALQVLQHARAGSLQLQTSNQDIYLPVCKRLRAEAKALGLPLHWRQSKGGHNHLFLRKVGGLEALAFHHLHLHP